LSSPQLAKKYDQGKLKKRFQLQLVLLHQIIFHLHTHTYHSTEHIFGNICPFGPINTAFSFSLTSAYKERRVTNNGPIGFELQLIFLHQLIFHLHIHTFH
jgi:hypothetical protein